MKPINVYFFRHSKTLGRAALNGVTDVEVDALRIKPMTKALEPITLSVGTVVTSPLVRCKALAEQIEQHYSLSLSIEPAICEFDFGDLDGVAFDDMDEKQQSLLSAFWQAPHLSPLPNGQTLDEFHQQVISWWEGFISELDGDTLVVSHAGVIRMVLAYVLSVPYQNSAWHTHLALANESITHFKIYPSTPRFSSVVSIGAPLQPDDSRLCE